MIPGLILFIVILSLVLIKAADMVVVSLRRISKETHTGVFALSAILLALGTSLPELFVAITSALEGSPSLSFGNVLGANIANISLVAGLSAFFAGRVFVRGDFVKRDVLIALIAGVLPLFLVLDRTLSRIDGLVLLSVYGAYSSSIFRKRFMQIAKEQQEETSFIYRLTRRFNHIDSAKTKELGKLFIGIALLLGTADAIVRVAQQLAFLANIPVLLVGLIVISIGTTLPEVAFSFRAIEEHEPTMFFGNLLGSIIANSTLVLGVAAVITPIRVFAFEEYAEAATAFILIFLTFWFFIKSKGKLDRWEAGLLLILYIIFVVVEFL